MSVTAKELNRRLVGQRIAAVRTRPFSDGHGRTTTDPEIETSDGTLIRFVVAETEHEYGVEIVLTQPRQS